MSDHISQWLTREQSCPLSLRRRAGRLQRRRRHWFYQRLRDTQLWTGLRAGPETHIWTAGKDRDTGLWTARRRQETHIWTAGRHRHGALDSWGGEGAEARLHLSRDTAKQAGMEWRVEEFHQDMYARLVKVVAALRDRSPVPTPWPASRTVSMYKLYVYLSWL